MKADKATREGEEVEEFSIWISVNPSLLLFFFFYLPPSLSSLSLF
jgi:hypothetical protein